MKLEILILMMLCFMAGMLIPDALDNLYNEFMWGTGKRVIWSVVDCLIYPILTYQSASRIYHYEKSPQTSL